MSPFGGRDPIKPGEVPADPRRNLGVTDLRDEVIDYSILPPGSYIVTRDQLAGAPGYHDPVDMIKVETAGAAEIAAARADDLLDDALAAIRVADDYLDKDTASQLASWVIMAHYQRADSYSRLALANATRAIPELLNRILSQLESMEGT